MTRALAAVAMALLVPAVAAGEEAPPAKPPLSLAPFVVLQGRLTSEAPADLRSGGEPTVEMRRVRLGFRLRTDGDALRVFVHTNVTQASPELIDAFVDHRIGGATLRWGQAKVPFTMYRQEQFFELPTADWAIVTRVFGAGRQLGAQLIVDPSGVGPYGSLGVFQGTQLRTGHDQGVAPVYGEPAQSYTDVRRSSTLDAVHPEAVGRLGVRLSADKEATVDVEASGRFDARPVEARDMRAAGAVESKATLGRLTLRAVGYVGLSELTQASGQGVTTGQLAQASVRLGAASFITVEGAQYTFGPSLRRDARERAARLSAEASEKDRASVAKAHAQDGASAGQWSALVAFRQNIGAYTSVTAEVARLRTMGVDDGGGSYRLRLQAQVAF